MGSDAESEAAGCLKIYLRFSTGIAEDLGSSDTDNHFGGGISADSRTHMSMSKCWSTNFLHVHLRKFPVAVIASPAQACAIDSPSSAEHMALTHTQAPSTSPLQHE